MTRALNTLISLMLLTVISSCQHKEKELKEAIEQYYFSQGINEGAGRLSVNTINILEKIERNDTAFVLAIVEGLYTHPALQQEQPKESSSNRLWFLVVKIRSHQKVVAIRDPEKYIP